MYEERQTEESRLCHWRRLGLRFGGQKPWIFMGGGL